jgi:Protein of unknown function (DUF1552)
MSKMNAPRFQRRTLLAGGISAGLASLFLRPLTSAAANGPPLRFLMVHKPCGTVLNRFFPTAGTETNFTLGPITAPFEALKGDMVMFDNLTAPRDGSWQGDRHGAGLISCVTGSRAISDGTPVDTDDQFHNLTAASPSIDQILIAQSPKLQGTAMGSTHLGAYRDSVQNGRIFPANGAPNFRVVSFKDANKPVFPEVRPDVAVQNLFGSAVPGGAAAVARQQQLNKSILDLVAKDLGALQKQVPSSERAKLDSHLAAIQQLEAQIAAMKGGASSCVTPTVPAEITKIPAGTPSGVRIDAVDHTLLAKEQLNTIKVAFQCDLIRSATFTYGHGNSDVQFGAILPSFGNLTGFHDISHLTDSPSVDQLAQADTYYCTQLAAFLLDLKNTPEGNGSNMLDNTLVVFFSDVSVGNNHDWKRMPVIFFGGKSLGLNQGRWINMQGRYMNDLWASTLAAFGVPLPSDNKFAGYDVWKGVTGPRLGQGAISGIFGP